jgi:hypothetical protein
MQRFIQKHAADVSGVLSGFDRMRFRGTLRWLANTKGMRSFLVAAYILLKDFKTYVTGVTEQIRAATTAWAESEGRPVIYLDRPSLRKEDEARRIAQRDGITEGLICVLTSVEPCFSYEVGPNRETKRLELRGGTKKCLHQYFYFLDPQFGFMHARLQTWFPFTIHVCLNGREWLARQLDTAGIGYRRRENCFIDLADPARAQQLCDAQLKTHWKTVFHRLLRRIHPTHAEIFREHPIEYYWSLEESEWATDVMFRSAAALAALYPRLLRHSLQDLSSADVMRFLGRKVPVHGGVNGHFQGEVVSDLKQRPEGLRIKHRLNHNSLKMYDKQASVLRVETTINDTRDMKVFRRAEGQREGARTWQRLRKGVADIHRRAKISQAANERYLEALADVEHTKPLGELVDAVCRPTQWNGQRVRALQPWAQADAQLLAAVARPEFALNGFRNRDLRPLLFGVAEASPDDTRRQSGKVTRQLRLLRAHGLITKVLGTHRYQLTPRGRTMITALLAARRANTEQLCKLAA